MHSTSKYDIIKLKLCFSNLWKKNIRKFIYLTDFDWILNIESHLTFNSASEWNNMRQIDDEYIIYQLFDEITNQLNISETLLTILN